MAGFNPNRKKKTYSFNRSQPPQLVSTVVNGKVEYFDETLVTVDTPFYILDTAVSQGNPPPFLPPEYDENTINFNWTDAESVSFSFTFSSRPYLTLEILPADGFENVALFSSYLSTTGFIANVSAPFSGQVVYRAISSAVYPVVVERLVESASFFYTASAGRLPGGTRSEFSATYHELAPVTNPSFVYFTPVDESSHGDADLIVVDTGSYGVTSTVVSFSAPIYNSVHYLVVKP